MTPIAHNESMVLALLGRPTPTLPAEVSQSFAGKTVLVTGGGGSIGSALCMELARCRVSRLIVVDACEFNLYAVDHWLTREFKSVQSIPVLCDILDREGLKNLFTTYSIDYVFHAAAHKHVPMVEKNPIRGLRVNVQGTKNVVELAEEFGVGNFVLVSTDKAVNPTNVMGASKRLAEGVCLGPSRRMQTKAVRFGNVLWSSGSVLPLFASQLESGNPVTLTDERVTRYFMSVREAVQLILRASILPTSGVYVFDMGEPVKIMDMVDRLAAWMNITSYKVDVIGLRPGEKLYEELTLGRGLAPTPDEKIMVAEEDHQMVDDLGKLFAIMELGDLLALRSLLISMGIGYLPESPIVDQVWVDAQIKSVESIYGDANEHLWVGAPCN